MGGGDPGRLKREGEGCFRLGRLKLSVPAELLSSMFEDLENHQHKEEAILFPAMIAGMGTVLRHPNARMMQDHEDLGELLAFLADLTDNFVPPDGACST